jgi:hypothetical protein
MISLNNLIPEIPTLPDLQMRMAKAAIREAVRHTIAVFLISMTGLGEGLREDSNKQVRVLFRPVREIWVAELSRMSVLPPDELCLEKDAFLLDDRTRSLFNDMVDRLSEPLVKRWADRQNSPSLS